MNTIPQTRDHHFKVKTILASMAIQDIERYFKTFSSPGGPEYLEDLWNGLGMELPEAQRIDSHGLNISVHTLKNNLQAIAITLPEPQRRNEAYFLAAIRLPNGMGLMIGLERSVHPMTSEVITMLVGWSPQGRMNFGPGPLPTMEAFLEAVSAVVKPAR
jgi:hypothetical protein